MANFFEPGNASATQTTAPSAASQALDKFRVGLLGQLLGAVAGGPTSFKDFVGGAPAARPVPAGLNSGIGDLLAAMNQPGAFNVSSTTSGHGPTTSGFSDLASLLGLGAGLYQSGLPQSALSMLGGWLGIGKTPGPQNSQMPSNTDTGMPAQANPNVANDPFLNSLYPTGADSQIPMAGAGASQDDFLNAILGGYGY